MENIINELGSLAVNAGGKLVQALLVFIIGRIVVNKLISVVRKLKPLEKMDPSVRSFVENAVKVVLYCILIVSIISILGVPMASVVTVLASCGVAVGMALQGALGNLAGGIMIMIFRPFSVGDYVITAGAEGVVKEINTFYTVITTVDNKRITVPNGNLMGANVTNCSSEPLRRVDLVFNTGKGQDIQKIQEIMCGVMNANDKVLREPDVPFARISGGSNEAMEFTTRAWVKSEDYWEVYFALIQDITAALGEAGIEGPAVRIIETK